MRAQRVSDNSIDFITPEFVREYFEEYDESIEELILSNYANENNINIDDLKDENFVETKEFKEYYNHELLYWADNAINMFKNDVIQLDNTIPIWRELTVDKNWIDHLNSRGKHLGIYWSWDKDAVEAHWGHNTKQKKKYVIESIINANHVDWKNTILLNMDPTLGKDEKEIRLYKNTPLEIVSLEIGGKNVINLLTQKILLA